VKCNIASRRCDVNDIIELGPKAQEMALVMEAQSLAERDTPVYVVPDGTSKVTFTRVPKLDEVPYPVRMEPNPGRRILLARAALSCGSIKGGPSRAALFRRQWPIVRSSSAPIFVSTSVRASLSSSWCSRSLYSTNSTGVPALRSAAFIR
jgi:hypothetical protein